MLEVLSSGLLTTVQDSGRLGYRKYGVPVSGAMDSTAAQLANQLLGNNPDCAVLEMTLVPPTLLLQLPTTIAITGALAKVTLNDNPIAMYEPVGVPKNSTVRFEPITLGARIYVAVRGGFTSPKVLGSRSFYKPITGKDRLQKGDQIPYATEKMAWSAPRAKISPPEIDFDDQTLYVHQGPEFDALPTQVQRQLLTTAFTVNPQSNRMAVLLDAPIKLSASEITTGPVQLGTVQLTPSGKLIVLMRDAQTTGGYARVLQLSEKAINQLAQKQPGEAVAFVPPPNP